MNARMILIACISAAALTGCEEKPDRTPVTTPPARTPTSSPPANTSDTTRNRDMDTTAPKTPASTQPDNTANNRRDRDMNNPATKTPMDQSNAQSDIDITAKIRSSIMADKSMSTNAQNCKIITEKGAVTLRGVVNSDAEKTSVESIAKATPNVVSVDNQLEVKATP